MLFLLTSSLTEVAPTDLVYDAADVGVLFDRSSWVDTAATWLTAVAGPYDQSHTHEDAGSRNVLSLWEILAADLMSLYMRNNFFCCHL